MALQKSNAFISNQQLQIYVFQCHKKCQVTAKAATIRCLGGDQKNNHALKHLEKNNQSQKFLKINNHADQDFFVKKINHLFDK